MEPTANASAAILPTGRQRLLEIALVFGIFFVQGAWPVPDSNEPCYLGKAIHYWNPAWIPNDFFLNSADSHAVFYLTVGWLSFWLTPTVLAWVVRTITWGLLAWAWWRLSWALLPRRWYALLTAALFVCLAETCNMAGEWVIGGAEGKGFAYVLVLLGIEALVRQRWNWAWICFGAGAMFHVLVGGWAVIAGGVAWALAGPTRPSLRAMLPGLVGGFLLALPGLIPGLRLTWGVDPEIVRQANAIYVYGRLPHHLVFSAFAHKAMAIFGGLLLLWWGLCRVTPRQGPTGRLQGFVSGALAIGVGGMLLNLLMLVDPPRAAGLLRLYWFRLVDVTVPLGVALLGPWWIAELLPRWPRLGRGLLAATVAVAGFYVGNLAYARTKPTVPRTVREYWYAPWRDVCDWIARSPEIRPQARFITPRLNTTFKWYTGHGEVAVNKDLPQDAVSIVEWWDRLNRLYGTGSQEPEYRWRDSLTELSPQRLRELGARYDAEYLVTAGYPPLDLPLLYQNSFYAVYRLTPPTLTPQTVTPQTVTPQTPTAPR